MNLLKMDGLFLTGVHDIIIRKSILYSPKISLKCSILFTNFQLNSGLKILQFQELQKGASEGHQDKIISINSTQIIFLHEQCANSNSKKLAFEAFASYYGAKIKST